VRKIPFRVVPSYVTPQQRNQDRLGTVSDQYSSSKLQKEVLLRENAAMLSLALDEGTVKGVTVRCLRNMSVASPKGEGTVW
jgi:hypothetical protein